MCFDFANYTFSGIISIFAAIIGLAFPFILQMAHRFQDIYKTDNVIDWFTDEKRYKDFLWWLKFSIPTMALVPFVLLLVQEHDWAVLTFLTIQTGVAATLMCRLVLLYYLVIDYSSSKKLASRTSEDDTEKLAHLMLISDSSRNIEAYNTAKDKLYQKTVRYLADMPKGHPVSISGDMEKIIRQILRASCETGKYPWTSKDAGIVFLLYDCIYFRFELSDQIYEMMWRTLNAMVRSRNMVWLQSYWDAALQYATFMRGRGTDGQGYARFRQMHFFFGSLLLGAGYDDMLRHILTFRNSTPEPSPLVPATEQDIFGTLLETDRLRSKPFELSRRYQMIFLPLDVRSDERIYGAFMDYMVLALFLLQLNRSYYGAQEFQLPDGLAKENLIYIQEFIKSYRSLYERTAREYARFLPGLNERDTYFAHGMQAIERVLNACGKELDKVEKNDEVDPAKVEKLKQSLIDAYSRTVFPLREDTDRHPDWETSNAELCVQATVSPGQVMKRQHIASVNFEDVVMDMMCRQVYARVSHLFLLNKPSVSFYIQYRDILEAFDRLNVDRTYILLCNGVNLWNYGRGRNFETNIEYKDGSMSYKGMGIKDIGSRGDELFVMRKEDAPYFTVIDAIHKKELTEIEPDNKLYWAAPTKENNLSMTLCQTVSLHIPVPLKYIRLKISYDTAKGKFDMDKIKDIRHYVV